MKQMMMAAASVAMAITLTGCGGSPKGIAEDFVDAVIQRETDKAVRCMNVNNATSKEIKDLKEKLDNIGKDINDTKLEAEAINEVIYVPAENSSYQIVNGAKVTGDKAEVIVQFIKGKDRKSTGMRVRLIKVDGSWVVTDDFRQESDLDTSDK